MNARSPLTAAAFSTDAPGWERPAFERQLELLGRLAEVGLNIALAVERQATGKLEEGEAPVAADVSLAYAKVSRAVRMTIALQSKLIAELRALEADEPPPLYIRKARVERILERVIKAEHEGENPEAVEDVLDRLVIEAGERLDDEDVYGDVLTRPMSEVLAQICKDLGLSPDWLTLAQEPWAQAEIDSGKVGWPLATSPARGGGGPRSGGEGIQAQGGFDGATETSERRHALSTTFGGPPLPPAGEVASP